MPRNNLSKLGRRSYVVRIWLKKDENTLIRGLADTHFAPTHAGKPAISKAVAHLLRVAFNCIKWHGDRYQDPEPISFSEAQQEGLRTPQQKAKVKFAKVATRKPGEARKLPDDP